MMQLVGDTICEQPTMTVTQESYQNNITVGATTYYPNGYYGDWQPIWTQPVYCYWQNYPVYVCLDKTKKAIEVLKALQAAKLIKCESVPKFIALVEQIAGLL